MTQALIVSNWILRQVQGTYSVAAQLGLRYASDGVTWIRCYLAKPRRIRAGKIRMEGVDREIREREWCLEDMRANREDDYL